MGELTPDRQDRLANMRAAETALNEEIAKVAAQLSKLRAERRELRTAALPVAVGDIVIATTVRAGANKGDELIVRSIQMHDYDKLGAKPWVMASRRRADGEWSKAAINLFNDWRHMDGPPARAALASATDAEAK